MLPRFAKGPVPRGILWILVIVALLMSAYYFGALLIAQQIFNGVCGIFWAIGRALLNGYTLYEDIFETKPPLIFLMSAVSMKLFGNQSLGIVLHTALLLGVPLALIEYARRRAQEAGSKSVALMTLAFLVGSVLVRYLSRHPTAWAIEFYGLAFSCLYLLLLADTKRFSWKRIALLSLCLIGAVGMKESFVLVIIAGAFLVALSREAWTRGVLLPIFITGIVGTAALLALGSLHAYITVYLPEMFGYYIQRFYIPLILKGFAFDKVFGNLLQFSGSFLLFILIAAVFPLFVNTRTKKAKDLVWMWIFRIVAVLWICMLSATSFIFYTTQGFLGVIIIFLIHRLTTEQSKETRSASVVALATAVVMLASWYSCYALQFFADILSLPFSSAVCVSPPVTTSILFVMGAVTAASTFLSLWIPRGNDERPFLLSLAAVLVAFFVFYFSVFLSVFPPFVWTTVTLPIGIAWVTWTAWKKRSTEEGEVLQSLGLRLVAFIIVTFAISMGSDYQGHHYLSVVPVLLAFFLPLLDLLASGLRDATGRRLLALWLGAISLVVILNPLRHPSLDDLRVAIRSSDAEVSRLQVQARRIDDILDACGIPRYFVIGAGDVYAFTRHTPGNYFLWAALEAIRHHPTVSERTIVSVAKSDIIFIGPGLAPIEKMSPEEEGTLRYIAARFTEEPRDCAKHLRKPDDMTVLYRQIATPSVLQSASSMRTASSSRLVFASQPSFFFAFDESPRRRSTSAGR